MPLLLLHLCGCKNLARGNVGARRLHRDLVECAVAVAELEVGFAHECAEKDVLVLRQIERIAQEHVTHTVLVGRMHGDAELHDAAHGHGRIRGHLAAVLRHELRLPPASQRLSRHANGRQCKHILGDSFRWQPVTHRLQITFNDTSRFRFVPRDGFRHAVREGALRAGKKRPTRLHGERRRANLLARLVERGHGHRHIRQHEETSLAKKYLVHAIAVEQAIHSSVRATEGRDGARAMRVEVCVLRRD